MVVDNLVTGKRKNVPKAAQFYKLDIENPKLERIFRNERPSIVFHLAAQMNVRRSVEDPMFDAQVNVLGTLNVLEQASKHGARKVIFSSSGGAIYGEQLAFPAPETHITQPLSPYGISKLCGEHYLSYYHRLSGIQVVSLRYANVYGPRQDPEGEAGVVAIFIQKMLRGEQAVVNGNGRQTRDFVFVEDVVESNLMAMGPEVEGVYNVGTGIETSVNDLFKIVVDLTKVEFKEVHGPAKRGEQARSVIDSTKLHRDLGWEPKVEVREGARRTVQYFREGPGQPLELIAGHGWVYLSRPGINASDQVFHLSEALLQQKPCRIRTSHPVVAHGDNLGVTVKFAKRLLQGRQRDQDGSLQLGDGIFPWLPDVYQHQLVAFIQPRLEILRGNRETHQRTSIYTVGS